MSHAAAASLSREMAMLQRIAARAAATHPPERREPSAFDPDKRQAGFGTAKVDA
jgi:hypothetical protein